VLKDDYKKIAEWKDKEKIVKISIDDRAKMKREAMRIGARPYNRCEVYDKCNRPFFDSSNKRDKKAFYDKLGVLF
jgi:hypothetical protein